MKNPYFKILLTLAIFVCFSANAVSALPAMVKSKSILSDVKEGKTVDQSAGAEEKIVTPVFNEFQLAGNMQACNDATQSRSLKIHLPISYHRIPVQPPKRGL